MSESSGLLSTRLGAVVLKGELAGVEDAQRTSRARVRAAVSCSSLLPAHRAWRCLVYEGTLCPLFTSSDSNAGFGLTIDSMWPTRPCRHRSERRRKRCDDHPRRPVLPRENACIPRRAQRDRQADDAREAAFADVPASRAGRIPPQRLRTLLRRPMATQAAGLGRQAPGIGQAAANEFVIFGLRLVGAQALDRVGLESVRCVARIDEPIAGEPDLLRTERVEQFVEHLADFALHVRRRLE